MRKYSYSDGFEKTIDKGYITPQEMHDDEKEHGELVSVSDINGVVMVDNRRYANNE